MLLKNVASQKIGCFAYTASTGAAKTGDAAQITAYISKDFAAGAATNDVNPTEMDATNMPGWYVFDLTQAETNAEVIVLAPKSSTSGVVLDQVQVFTQDAAITSRASQTSVDTVDGIVDDILVDTGTTLDTLIKDIPTVAEFELRTLPSADYVVVGDTLAAVTTVTNLTNERSKYMHGAVWIGPVSNTNTVSYVDGIMTNPVSTIAAAKTIADALGLKRFWTQSGVTVTLEANYNGYVFDGVGWIMSATGGSRSVGGSTIRNAIGVTGVYSNAGGGVSYWIECEFGSTVTVAPGNFDRCKWGGTSTLSVGAYDFIDCASIVAGTGTPIFDCGAPASPMTISFRRWSGGIQLNNINSNVTVSIDMVSGGTVTLNGADGNVQVRGMAAGITDNRTGTPTLGQNAAINMSKINTEADTALTDYDGPTNAEFEARTLVAADYTVVSDLPSVPTAIENADALLKRDWTEVTGEAARSLLNAARFLRNKWSISAGTLTVTEEDDTTAAWTAAVTGTPSADPVTAVDPA